MLHRLNGKLLLNPWPNYKSGESGGYQYSLPIPTNSKNHVLGMGSYKHKVIPTGLGVTLHI